MLRVIVALLFVLLSNATAYAQETSFANLTQGTSFQQKYNPSQLVDDGFGRYVISYGDNGGLGKKIKMFMPPGTVMMTSSLINVQSGIPKAVWRFASPPQRPAVSVMDGEFPTQTGADLLMLLQTGSTDIAFSGFPGGLGFSDGGTPIKPTPQKGAYVYVDLFYNLITTFDTSFFVEKVCYTEWYNSMTANNKWTNGNPDPSATHTCSGSTGGGTVTPTDPTPTTQATISKAATVTSEANAPVTLEFEVAHPATEVSQAVDYWIAAKVPVGAMFFSQDEWFFAKQSALPTNPVVGWSQLTLPNPLFVAYQTTGPIPSAIKTFTLPLGFSKSDLSTLKVQLYFGYRINGGAFINKGMIWDATK